MCRPSCCNKSGGRAQPSRRSPSSWRCAHRGEDRPGRGRVFHVVIEALAIIALTAASVLACLLVTWLVIRIVRWRCTAAARRGQPAAGVRHARTARRPAGGQQVPGLRRYRNGAASRRGPVSAGPCPVCEPPTGPGDRHAASHRSATIATIPIAGPGIRPVQSQCRRGHLAVPHRTGYPAGRTAGGWELARSGHCGLDAGHPHRVGHGGHGTALDPAGGPARAWCVLSRHRIQRVCFETRMHTRSGRLPLVLRITPPKSGNARSSGAGPGSAPRTSKPTPQNSPPPAWPARPASRATSGGRNWSRSTSCAATPSGHTMSSPLASPGCLRNGGSRHDLQ